MDKIFINDLQIETTIGIYEWEKRIKQIVSIDIVMDADIAKASQSDKIADTLDYKAVSKKEINFVENSKVELVEVLVEKIAKIIIDEFEVPRVKVTVKKPGAIRGSKEVGISIERTQKD